MAEIRFVWDSRKAASNQKKHGVSFGEAVTAFSDERGLLIPDPDHSENEERFVLIGLSWSLRVLVVCHFHHEATGVIRIISARRATIRERAQYGARW